MAIRKAAGLLKPRYLAASAVVTNRSRTAAPPAFDLVGGHAMTGTMPIIALSHLASFVGGG